MRLRRRFACSVIHPGVSVDKNSFLGDYSVLFKNSTVYNSTVGSYSYLQENTASYFAEIGSFCSIAKNVTIGLFGHPTNMVSTNPIFYDNTQKLPRSFVKSNFLSPDPPLTVIEPDVWIGEGVKILSGVKVGVGSVMAHHVVTKNILIPLLAFRVVLLDGAFRTLCVIDLLIPYGEMMMMIRMRALQTNYFLTT